MIRSNKVPVRLVYNQQSSAYEANQSPTNVGDINSYIGKILTLNQHQVIVEQILGQGGFAFVFLVRSFNQQRYALKRMFVNNQRDLDVCQREISLVKEFSSHPNIVKYVDSSIQRSSPTNIQKRPFTAEYDNEEDAIYEILLLTEYCSNGALITRLNEQRNVGLTLNERQILRIFADVCNAVSACHLRRPHPIIHRDIKLENILIDARQNYILCDFGSSIILSDHQQYQPNQLTTSVIQQLEEEIQRYTTLSYRAPEMIDLYSRLPITLKVDIWAMGCLLYKLMYNIMPFGESILAIQNGTFIIPDDMSSAYSRELNLLVRYILEIDINKRPDIWQVSYITYKLLGLECPIPNRCQSKIPDLNTVSMPLSESETRQQQRTNALSKSKSSSTNVIDQSPVLGTAVNPRERPRGMITPSASLINFNQTAQRSPIIVAPPPPPPPSSSSNPSRSGSAAQLMFDDDFSQIPSHAISLSNIPTTGTERTATRARPSPPATISAASGLAVQQQLLPPPPSSSSSSSTGHFHRRSSSQTLSPINTQSSFPDASSVDLSVKQSEVVFISETSDNVDNEHTSSSTSDDDYNNKSISPNNRKTKKNLHLPKTSGSKNHHPSTEEAKKNFSSSNTNDKYHVKRLIERSSEQQDDPTVALTTFKQQNTSTLSNEYSTVHPSKQNDPDDNGFDQLINEDSDDDQKTNVYTTTTSKLSKRPLNEHNNQKSYSFIGNDNPFLRAPFHHLPANKQLLPTSQSSFTDVDMTTTTTNVSSFDSNSIVMGTKPSAFSAYQKPVTNSDNNVIDTTSKFDVSNPKSPDSGSFLSDAISDQLSPSKAVFTNAPFKTKSRHHQDSKATNKINTTSLPSSSFSNSQFIDLNIQQQSNIKQSNIKQSNIKPQQHQVSSSHQAVGSAGLASNFISISENNSNESLTLSPSKTHQNRHKKKMINETEPQQHAYDNSSFNNTIVDTYF